MHARTIRPIIVRASGVGQVSLAKDLSLEQESGTAIIGGAFIMKGGSATISSWAGHAFIAIPI